MLEDCVKYANNQRVSSSITVVYPSTVIINSLDIINNWFKTHINKLFLLSFSTDISTTKVHKSNLLSKGFARYPHSLLLLRLLINLKER
jgi:hypothetical protein